MLYLNSCTCNYLTDLTVLHGSSFVFETFAVVSTISLVVVFVALVRMDRAARRADASDDTGA